MGFWHTGLGIAIVTLAKTFAILVPVLIMMAYLTLAERRVLVCTDCLSEGINLQDHFDAVVHYDLSWNPTRHEQREGRVDRYGQGRGDLAGAIEAEHRIHNVELAALRADLDERVSLAAIERLIGGDL